MGVFMQNAISPLLLIVITRINGIHDSGIFSFAFSVALVFWAFSMWGGRTYQVSDVNREFSHHSYVVLRFALAIIVILGAYIFVNVNHYDSEKSNIIISLVVFKIVESIADAIYGVFQVHNRLQNVGKSLTYKAVAGFCLFVTIDLLTHNILLSCLGVAAANVVVVILYDLHIVNRLSSTSIIPKDFKQTTKSALHIMKRTWPILGVMFLSMFSLNIPRYFIDVYHANEIGYFGIIAMPITLIVLLMWFILQPNLVNLSTLYEERKLRVFNSNIKKIIAITVVIGIITLASTSIIGVPLLHWVFGVDFSHHWLPLMVVVTGGVVNAVVTVFIYVLIIMRCLKSQFYILLTTNTVLAFISPFIISQYSLLGGVILFVTINILQLLLLGGLYEITLKRARNTINKPSLPHRSTKASG